MPGRSTASAASRVFPTEAGNSEVISIRAPTRPAFRAPSARCILTCVAVRSVLRVRIMPSATSPHKTIPFWNTADRYSGMSRWRGVYQRSKFAMRMVSPLKAHAPFTDQLADDRDGFAGAGQRLGVHHPVLG